MRHSYTAPTVVATLESYHGETAWCSRENPLANHCCSSCHEDEMLGYSTLLWTRVGSVDVVHCCAYRTEPRP